SGVLVAEHTAEYDLNGNLAKDVARLMNADNSATYLDRALTYRYDPRDRVIEVNKGDRSEKYSYDANSNILSEQFSEPGGKTSTVANVHDRNRLVNTVTESPNDDGTITQNNSNYYYDSLGRLEQVRSSATRPGASEPFPGFTWYRYDGFDRKIEHEVNSGPVTDLTKYVYDSLDRTIADDRLTSVFTQDGVVPKNRTESTYRYAGMSDLVLSDERSVGSNKTTTSYRYGPNGE